MSEEVYAINDEGEVTTLYADHLTELGALKINRASNVEPEADGTWTVQLSDDPIFGEHRNKVIGSGFKTRAAALAFESAWINQNALS